jgi:cell fate regulator YaaT (PSP1 superfamily)
LTEIISIRFNEFGKAYFFDPAGHTISKGDMVVVETAKGLEYGECVRGNHRVKDDAVIQPLRPVVRIATDADNKNVELGKEKEKEAFAFCQKKIEELGLEMKLVSVEYGFEGSKILFFFTSDGRVDFRELVKDLAGMFRARIELRQIGVRDEAKMLGGLGVCGKQFCCSQFLTEFHPVSIKMAKTQGLSLNPAKISGACGRLMCCLKYEEVAYEELVKKAPKIGAFVETPYGKGSVTNVNILRGNAKVRLEDGGDTTLKTFTFEDLDVLGGKGRRAEYLTAKAEGKLEEAGFKESLPPPKRSPEPYDLSALVDREHSAGRQQGGTSNGAFGSAAHGTDHNRRKEHKHERNQRPEKSKPEYKVKHNGSGMENASSHPEPLDGSKNKKHHHKRRKNRGKH